MELIERRSRKLPMMFLVQIAQRHRVRQQLVEVVHTFPADLLRQRDRQLDEMSVRLDLVCVLMGQWLRLVQNRIGVNQSLCHVAVSLLVVTHACMHMKFDWPTGEQIRTSSENSKVITRARPPRKC